MKFRFHSSAALLALAASPWLAVAQTPTPSTAASAPAAAASAAQPSSQEIADKEAAAQLAASAWLSLLDRQNWGGAWDAASQVFRGMVPIGVWMDNVPKDRAPLGALVSRTPGEATYKTTLQGRPDGEYVTVVFATDYANMKGQEEVVTTVREPDGRWRVTGYSKR